MQCPKCGGTLETQTYGQITVRRCTQCHGLWCMPETLLALKEEYMAEVVIDSGDPSVGRKYNRVEDIDCPECGSVMKKSSDARQVHVWYEECPRGHGMFFDAGELTDLKFETLLDKVRGLLKGARPAS